MMMDRPPVSTYEQSVWWLICHWSRAGFNLPPVGPLPLEAALVCDLFWVTEAQLRNQIAKFNRDLSPASRGPRIWTR